MRPTCTYKSEEMYLVLWLIFKSPMPNIMKLLPWSSKVLKLVDTSYNTLQKIFRYAKVYSLCKTAEHGINKLYATVEKNKQDFSYDHLHPSISSPILVQASSVFT
jgi:hypothetical protein